ncbi:hypothetical protein GCM10007879_09590 [Maritalea porphyrae]|uniref:Restriction endonuclease n=2 Tax=Maritalea porphyrae TaxID=880732 RepID=A0ABQ5UN44_9HYPH|nr:hypothetical protein GCM10007879_09590 [Maritalea porphyrae]
MAELRESTLGELLKLHIDVNEELRTRGVLRSNNNPTGDLTEYLFCLAFGWQQAPNSEKSFDATDSDGIRYQIKGRRVHRRNKSRQLSSIRDFSGFDFLAAALFDDSYKVSKAIILPAKCVVSRSVYVKHTNSYKFMLRDEVWATPEAIDVTSKLCAAENS